MTGLQLLYSTEANASVLKVAVSTLCKNNTEAGFVGAPHVGASRAERAPQLSVGTSALCCSSSEDTRGPNLAPLHSSMARGWALAAPPAKLNTNHI